MEKSQLGTTENTAFLKALQDELLAFGTGFASPSGASYYLGDDGRPMIVVFTIQNIEVEKRREEHLIRIAMTDELTRLYNRRCYDEDLDEYRKDESSKD